MDEGTKIIASIFGTIVTILLGLIANGVMNISRKQGEQTTQIALLDESNKAVIKRVESLHEWRNSLQKAELDHYKSLVKELQDVQ